jgi:Fic family protein
MKPEDFTSDVAGTCRKVPMLRLKPNDPESHNAFSPKTLPPILDLDWKLISLLSEADRAIGDLSGAGQILANPHLLIRPYLFREALLSSRIENTYAEMDELLLFEVDENARVMRMEIREVFNYVRALEHGLKVVRELPISKRLICEMHKTLLVDVRGSESSKTPGELRRSQNWIGGTTPNTATFVPPPPDEMLDALSDWEKYLHSDSEEPPLIKCAILHYQFEAIHPFLDGNGRVGRTIISLFLSERKLLSQPLLYLSGYFDENRDAYYDKLLAVSQRGAWREWIEFFLLGIRQQARSALKDAQAVLALYKNYQNKLKEAKRVPRTAAQILDVLFANPYFSISRYVKKSGESFPNVNLGVQFWTKRGLLEENTGGSRNRLFVAKEILGVMNAACKTVLGGFEFSATPTDY